MACSRIRDGKKGEEEGGEEGGERVSGREGELNELGGWVGG